MNSSLYKNNLQKFTAEKIRLQDKIKQTIKLAESDLGQGYESAVQCKQLMLSLLNS